MGCKVLAIIGARLNSSRLPAKHLLPLAGKPMIAHIHQRLRRVEVIDHIVLATTADDYNQPLVEWAGSDDMEVLAFTGDVNDLMGRVDAVIAQHDPEIIVYVCGDSPLIDPEVLQGMISAVIDDPTAETVQSTRDGAPIETIHEGFSIYRRNFWQRMMAASEQPFEREHVGSVYGSLGKVMPEKIAAYEEISDYCDFHHRLSVDTPSDYRFMSRVYDDWFTDNPDNAIVSLKWLIERLRREPELVAINAHVRQKAVQEAAPSITLLTEVGPGIGLGHLARTTVAARALQDYLAARVEVLILGPEVKFAPLALLPHRWLGEEATAKTAAALQCDILLIDCKSESTAVNFMAAADCPTIAIDGMLEHTTPSLCYVPAIHVEAGAVKRLGARLQFGWDALLLPLLPARTDHAETATRTIVITGGDDVTGLGQQLPARLDDSIKADLAIDWVQGPYAPAPQIPDSPSLHWDILKAPDDLAQRLHTYDVAVSAYGVSFFECLKSGLPTVTIRAPGQIPDAEWQTLREADVALLAESADDIPRHLTALLASVELRQKLSQNARSHLRNSDGQRLADAVRSILDGQG